MHRHTDTDGSEGSSTAKIREINLNFMISLLEKVEGGGCLRRRSNVS